MSKARKSANRLKVRIISQFEYRKSGKPVSDPQLEIIDTWHKDFIEVFGMCRSLHEVVGAFMQLWNGTERKVSVIVLEAELLSGREVPPAYEFWAMTELGENWRPAWESFLNSTDNLSDWWSKNKVLLVDVKAV